MLTRRLLQLLPMLFFISLVAFLLVKLAPGDPVAAYITPRYAPRRRARSPAHPAGLVPFPGSARATNHFLAPRRR